MMKTAGKRNVRGQDDPPPMPKIKHMKMYGLDFSILQDLELTTST